MTIGILTHGDGEEALLEFFQHLNSSHSRPTDAGDQAKLTNAWNRLHASSAHPTAAKHNMVGNMFRSPHNPSNGRKEESSLDKFASNLPFRYNEHVRDMIARKEETPMVDHFRIAQPTADDTPPSCDVKVLYRAKHQHTPKSLGRL